ADELWQVAWAARAGLLERRLELRERAGLSEGRAGLARAGFDRRRFLAMGLGCAALPLVGCGGSGGVTVDGRRVGVVGAGLAGLHAAWRLERGGLPVRVFDAGERIGGRLLTLRDQFEDGLVAELGGEFIEAEHRRMRALAGELGVALDLLAGEGGAAAAPDVFHFGGRVIGEDELARLMAPVASAMASVASQEDDDAAFGRYDAMSIEAWLDDLGVDGITRAIVELACVGEYGRELDEQSLWNLIWLVDAVDVDAPADLILEDEARYHAHTGSQTFAERLAASLGGEVELGARLVAVAREADGRVRLSFARGASAFDEVFDEVVFALPFNQLRQVAFAFALPVDKQRVIDGLGMGTNAKLVLGASERVWRTRQGQSGTVTTDVGALQAVWDTGRGVASPRGVLTNFVGGARGVALGAGEAEERAAEVLPWVEAVMPGFGAVYEAGSAVRMHWPSAPLFEGSYSCYRPGQASFSGLEGTSVGNLHFCGEHASVDYQGLMEGAVETSAAVAAVILARAGRGSAGGNLRAWGMPARVAQPAIDGAAARSMGRLGRRRVIGRG
ncbi:MAG: FAD-dependent oxidoreductase, partial [Myxococcales bacterium]|nr:FAD-dependent oxidoreductase [Myxococcales bacterium]